jgi:hypothetical protein
LWGNQMRKLIAQALAAAMATGTAWADEGYETLRWDAVTACIVTSVQNGTPAGAAVAECKASITNLEAYASGLGIDGSLAGFSSKAIEKALGSIKEGSGGSISDAGAAVTANCAGGDPRLSEDGGAPDAGDDGDFGNYQDADGTIWQCDGSVCVSVGDVTEVSREPMRTAGENACTAAVETANILLTECNRRDWKTPSCQQLAAKLNGCLDPRQIFVDPDSGYACGSDKVDPENVKEAFDLACSKVVRGVEGSDPCGPPTVIDDGRGWPATTEQEELCRNPFAYTTDDACIVEVSNPTDIEPGADWESVIAVFVKEFGGPGVGTAVIPGLGPIPPPRGGPNCIPGKTC